MGDRVGGSADDGAIGRVERQPALAAFVESVEHLPLFSATAIQLIRSVEREDISTAELGRLILSDAALVAHLLRIVNSAYFGLSRRVATVPDAFAVLGFNLVRRTITAAILKRPLFAYLHDTATARAFWRHELLCAALARHLALRKGLDGEIAYMAGLMHDVGRLAMMMRFGGRTDLLRRDDGDDGPRREHETFGFDHAQVGGALMSLWDLPDAIVAAASRHADDVEPVDPMAASVWNANLLSHDLADAPDAAGTDDDADDHTGDEAATSWMAAIGLTPASRRRMLDEIAALESEQG